MPARHMDVVRCLHEPTACGVQAPAIALLRRMTAIGLMVRPTLRQQYAPLACLLVAFDIQAPAFPPLIKRHGGLQARQRRAALVPSCNELLAGRRKNLVMPEFAVALGKSGPWAYARFAPSRKAHKSLYVTYKRRVGVISKSAVDIAAGHRGRLRFDLDVRRARHRQVAPPALVMSMAYLTGSWDCRGIAERDVLIYDAPAPLSQWGHGRNLYETKYALALAVPSALGSVPLQSKACTPKQSRPYML